MGEKNNGDLKINGVMTLPGGKYETVKINGHLTLTNDIACSDITVNGMLEVEGKTKASNVKINGSADFNGETDFDSLSVMGKTLASGDSKIKNLKVEGQMRVAKSLSAEEVVVRGILNINENCNTELFKTKGAFTVDGMLNADTIEVELHGRCSANEIGGEKISVIKGRKNYFNKIISSIFSSFNFFDIRLIANTIEGDNIYLEHTKAKTVRGDSVTIGPNCEIDIVEYKNVFSKTDDSIVKQNKKV